MLQDDILLGWEDLLPEDASAVVRIAVLELLGAVAAARACDCAPTSREMSLVESAVSEEVVADSCLASRVEARVLTLFLASRMGDNAAMAMN